MSAVLLIFAVGAAIWAQLYRQGRRAKQSVRDTDALLAAERERDSYGDALRDILDRADWAGLDAVRATARAALAIGSYSGELAAAREARDLSAAKNAVLRARLAAAGLPVDVEDAEEPAFHGHQMYREVEDQ